MCSFRCWDSVRRVIWVQFVCNALWKFLYTSSMDKKINKRVYMAVSLGALYLFGPVFFVATDPSKLPLPLLIIPFLWLFTCIFVTMWLLLRQKRNVAPRQAVIVAGVVATFPVLLAVFQSIHQLSIRDVLLSVTLVVFTAIYLLRADFISHPWILSYISVFIPI